MKYTLIVLQRYNDEHLKNQLSDKESAINLETCDDKTASL